MNCIGRLASCGPAVALWVAPNTYSFRLCQACLDAWFDNADDDPDLEPLAWEWLTTHAYRQAA